MHSGFCRGIELLSTQESGSVQSQEKVVESPPKSASEHMGDISGVPKNVTQLKPILGQLMHKVIMIAIWPICYILGLTQGAFFIFHLLTKPFPSCDQPPIHLDHMTNHLTSHLTTHMTSHVPSQSPAPQSHLFYVTCFPVTCASPDTPSPDLT